MSKRGMSPETAQMIRKRKGITDTKLQQVRVSRGLSQSELSVVSGVSIDNIKCYEQRNKRNVNTANLQTVMKLCSALKCRIEDILEN